MEFTCVCKEKSNLEVSDGMRTVGNSVETRNLGVVEAGEDVWGDAVANDGHVAGNDLGHDLVLQCQGRIHFGFVVLSEVNVEVIFFDWEVT